MERSKALEVTKTLQDLESAENFLDDITGVNTFVSDIPIEMYDALRCFANEWVQKYKQKLEEL